MLWWATGGVPLGEHMTSLHGVAGEELTSWEGHGNYAENNREFDHFRRKPNQTQANKSIINCLKNQSGNIGLWFGKEPPKTAYMGFDWCFFFLFADIKRPNQSSESVDLFSSQLLFKNQIHQMVLMQTKGTKSRLLQTESVGGQRWMFSHIDIHTRFFLNVTLRWPRR